MIAFKVIANARLAAASNTAVASSAHFVLAARSTSGLTRKQCVQIALQFNRSLVQSPSQNQKVTNANQQHQRLIPIARNIYFRQCNDHSHRTQPIKATKAAYSVASDHSQFHPYVATADHPGVFGYPQSEETHVAVDESESTFNRFKRRARGALEKQRQEDSNEGNTKFYGQIFNKATVNSASKTEDKKLVVLMSWLEAREKHIEKYRQYYLERGYDVLNVKTSPLDLLLPTVGAKKISKDFVKFLAQEQYDNVVLHGFSVGGYQFGEFLVEVDVQEPSIRNKIINSIKGIVFDSVVPIEGVPVGVANSISRDKFIAKFLEYMIKVYMVVAYGFATKHYQKASEKVWSGPLKCPAIFFFSKDDKISDYNIVKRLSDVWSSVGINVDRIVFEKSGHVQHFQTNRELYTSKLQQFLDKIKSP